MPLSVESAPTQSEDRSADIRSPGSAVVEFWGLPQVGKSVLLASLFRALIDFELGCAVTVPSDQRDAFASLVGPAGDRSLLTFKRRTGGPGADWDPSEELRFAMDISGAVSWNVCVRARPGEQLLAAAASPDAAERWLVLRRGTMFIACVNPFPIDETVAWRGLQQLMAWLTAPPWKRSLVEAFSLAAATLLHTSEHLLSDRDALARVLPEAADVSVQYDPSASAGHDPFSWCFPDGRRADETRAACFAWLREQIRLAAPAHQLLRRALAASRNSVAVLTHIDLIDAMLSSIAFADVERVFDHLFEGRIDHHVGQQVAARLFQIDLSLIVPTSDLPSLILAARPGILRHDAGVRLLEYFHVTLPRAGQAHKATVASEIPGHTAPQAKLDPASIADAVDAVRAKAKNKLAGLKRIAQAAVAERDAAIKGLRKQLRAKEAQVTKLSARASTSWSGLLSPEESTARDQYERGRIGITQAWALLVVKSLPALPLAALVAAWFIGATNGSSSGAGRNFLIVSLITLAVYGAGSMAGLVGLWRQLGPRWIWLRRFQTRSAALEVLTSGGEALSAPASEFTLERSPVLGLLGIAVVRQNASGRRFVTSEPGAWLDGPHRLKTQWRILPDCLLLISVAAWLAWAIVLLVRS